ncbi:hypothetical protein MASR2M74_29110 [Paracoccaceae bacterium]
MLLAAALCLAALPAGAKDDARWNELRARLFSQVCIASAPGYTDFAQRAKPAGFKRSDGNLMHPPEVVVSLIGKGGRCTCLMSMGAPDPDTLATAIYGRIVADHPGGNPQAGVLRIGGADVRVELKAKEIDGAMWMAATATVKEACPK